MQRARQIQRLVAHSVARIPAIAGCSRRGEFISLIGAVALILIGSLAFWLNQPAGLFARRPPAVALARLHPPPHQKALHLVYVSCHHATCTSACAAALRN